jgi:serine/threonine protein kinase
MSCFSIQQQLGDGGNGVVFKAIDPSGTVIAVKAFKGPVNKAKA